MSWSKTWGGTGNDYVRDIVQTSDGGYAIVGDTRSFGFTTYNEVFIARFDDEGTLIWDQTWGGANSDCPYALIQTSDGGFAVAGDTRSYTAGMKDAFILKYDSDGTLIWDQIWGGTSSDSAKSIIQTTDGGYLTAGSTGSFGGGSDDAFIAKYADDGTLTWSRAWGGGSYDYANSVIQASNGDYVIAGYTESYGAAGSTDAFIARFNSSGTLIWDQTWGGATDSEWADTIINTNDGNLIIIGDTYSFGAGLEDAFIAKFTSNGTLVWDQTWGGEEFEWAYDLAKTTDGDFIVTGGTSSFTSDTRDAYVAKFTSAGIIINCSSPMCQDPDASTSSPEDVITPFTAIVSSPLSPNISSPVASVSSPPNVSSTYIVLP